MGIDGQRSFFFSFFSECVLSLLAALLTLLSNFVSRSLCRPSFPLHFALISPPHSLLHPSLATCHPLAGQNAGLLHDGLQNLLLTALWRKKRWERSPCFLSSQSRVCYWAGVSLRVMCLSFFLSVFPPTLFFHAFMFML